MGRLWLPLLAGVAIAGTAWAQDEDMADAGSEELEDLPEDIMDASDEGDDYDIEIGPTFNDGEDAVIDGTPVEEIYEPPPVDDGYTDVAVKSRVLPVYPDELQVLYGEQAIRCEAAVWIDSKGAPLRINMVDCPDGFHLAALSAMQKWKWEAPSGYSGSDGVKVRARTGFNRKDRKFYPGVTYFRSPEEVTADLELSVMLKSGKMPRYPKAVNAGDDICLVEVHVDAKGNTRDPIVDECAKPFRRETAKVLKGWKWWRNGEAAKGEETTVVTEIVFRL